MVVYVAQDTSDSVLGKSKSRESEALRFGIGLCKCSDH